MAAMPNQTIPLDVLHGILILLPVKAILSFKSVSKEWFSLINDPCFVKQHLKQSVKTNNLKIIAYRYGRLVSLPFDSVNVDNPIELNHPLKSHQPGRCDDHIQVLGSYNGLLCLRTEKDGTMVLWNISTGDYKVLPDDPEKLGAFNQWISCGFGYDSFHDDYKLERIIRRSTQSRSPRSYISKVRVYSLKTNTWRTCGEIFNYYITTHWRIISPFVCGALHWIGTMMISGIGRSVVIAVCSCRNRETSSDRAALRNGGQS
ncbi:hypothetical protein PTKIN_Ptkin12aG0181500 [Pterospermum kingtungense]